MQKELGPSGLVVISVHLLIPLDFEEGLDKARKKAENFLGKIEASSMIHVWLDEPDDLWMKKFDINGYPDQFVFNRSNRVADKFFFGDQAGNKGKDPDPKALEVLVRKLIAGKD